MKTKKMQYLLCLMLFFSISFAVKLRAAVPAAISTPYPADNATNVSTTLPQLSWRYVQGGAGAPTGYKVWLWDGNHSPSGFTFKFEMYGKLYYLANSATTYANARTACNTAGGKLASSFSAQMNTLLLNNAPTTSNCWLGGTDEVVEGTFVWEDGQPWSYTNWNTATGEPNNSGNEDYIEMYTSGSYVGKWNDCNGAGNRYYFLELPGRIIHEEIAGASSWDLNINLLPNHTYYWTIVPFNADGNGPNSTLTFTTGAAGSAPGTSSLVGPSGSGVALNPTLSWSAVSGATYYKLYMWKARGNPDAYGNPQIGVRNGHVYYKSASAATWATARDNCSGWGAHLGTINSAEENEFLTGLGENLWIGMHDINVEGDIRWVTGEPLNYTNWNPGEPNGDAQDCVHIYNSGMWDDDTATVSRKYIIEYPGTIMDGKVVTGTSYSFKDVNLEPNSTYYWVAIPYNQYGRPWTSQYWGFTTGASGTAPGIISVSTITPSNGAAGVAINAPLTWTAPTGSPTEYYAYLGTNNTCDYSGNYQDLGFWNGHHYFRHTLYSCTWQQAEAYAELDGGLWSGTGTGYLATIGSVNEKNKLAETAGNNRWFGGTDRVIPNIWKWSNGDPWVYTNWYTGEPNNNSPGQYYTVNNWNVSGQWDDQDTTTGNLYYFLMETVPNIADGTRVASESYTPSLLRFNTTYYWSAVGSNNYGMANDTQRWSFTTHNGKAENPLPAHLATGITAKTFNWDDIAGATNYNFYLGTASGTWDIVNGAACPTSNYTYVGSLNDEVTYYWKVATISPLETVQGDIWNFEFKHVDIDWLDGVTGSVDEGIPSEALIHGVTGNCPYTNQIPFNGTIGYFFTLTLDDATFPVDVTITLDHVALGYAPGQIGWYVEGFGWTFDPDPWLGVPLAWTNPGTANASVTITITNAKKDRADTDVVIAFSGTPDGPLPVILSSFTAFFTGSSSILNWTTQSEVNNSHWNIYRADNDNFTSAFKVNSAMIYGAGTTSELTKYSYVDNSGFEYNVTYYYWLESVDYANISAMYGPISVEIPEQDNPEAPEVPVFYGLSQNYPNPFNPSTEIMFKLQNNGNVTITVYNVKGEKVTTLFNGFVQSDDVIKTVWYGIDNHNNPVASGVYYYKLESKERMEVKKMLLIK